MPDPSSRERNWSGEVRARLSSLHLSPARESEIVEELSQHLDDRWRELIAGGKSPDEAAQLALAEFKGGDVIAKDMAPLRQAHPPAPITPGAPTQNALAALVHNLRYAVRILWKPPGFAAVAVLTLALGIGATTAIFSVVYGVLLKPLPFREPERLVALYHVTPARTNDFQGDATYFTYRENGRVFEDIGLWISGNVSVTRNGAPEQIQMLRVTGGMLPLLGVQAELGRLLGKDDDVPAGPLRVLLTHAYWQQAFGGAKDVIGKTLVINTRPHEIVGVLPRSFKMLNEDPQVVLAMRLNRAIARTGPLFMNGLGRLKPGVTLSQAHDDIARMIPLLPTLFPFMPGLTQEMWDGVHLAPNVRPLSEAVIGQIGRPLWILLGTVGIVLVMAWTNVANLLLVRAEGRQRGMTVRVALGASRGRIAAELMSESLILGLAGGALGLLFAGAGIGLLRRLAPVALPRVDDIGIGAVVLLVTLATSIVTSLLFGIIPVLRFRVFNAGLLQESGRSSTDAPGRHRTRNTLVVAQVALALVLLVVSGLMARTFVAMRQVQPGFVRAKELQTFRVALPAAIIRDPLQVARAYEQMATNVTHVPGVTSVGMGSITMAGVMGKAPMYVQGQPESGLPPVRSTKVIAPNFFETMGNPLVAGRAVTWNDVYQSTPVMVVSESLAREYWDPPARAIGQRMAYSLEGPWIEIVGVAGNERADGLNRPAPQIVYFPFADRESVGRNLTFVVRSSRAGDVGFVRELQHAVGSVNPNVALAGAQTLDDVHANSMAQTSFAMVMLVIAASVALLLGIVGIYGVVRYVVAQRTREIGIRMALGAHAGDVRRLFLRHGLALTMAGIAIGIGAAVLATRVMSALLFGVSATDPATYVAASVALAGVAALATYLPARRASAVDPVVALRSDA